MEGIGELINFGSKTVNDLKGELAEACKTIGEEKGSLEKIVVLEKGLDSEDDADDSEAEVNPSPILERKAEEIILKECWGLVFRNLNAEDMLSCRQVCKTFHQLLDFKEFKVKWNFHRILPILFPYLKISDPDWSPVWDHLYNVRLVCRSWRYSIDKYTSEIRYFPTPQILQMPLLNCFRTSEDFEEFQQRFGKCTTNPFPSRTVFIKSPYKEPVEDEDYKAQIRAQDAFIEKVGDFLEQFGKHIYRMRLIFEQISGPYPLALNLCKLLKRITIHLPNMREFDIVGNEPRPDYGEDEVEVDSFVTENALAPLPKLQALDIHCPVKVENYLLDAFGPQLTQLERPFVYNLLSRFQMQQLKSLRKLWLGFNDMPKVTLESLRFLESPLEHLKLNCGSGSEQSQVTLNLDEGLRNLKHLPIELLEIRLWSWNWGRVNMVETGIDKEEYNNASIKTLIIHIDFEQLVPTSTDSHRISFNFLPALTKLENLEFKFSQQQLGITHPEELPEVVKLNDYFFGEEGTDLPYHSNVWEEVPSLKTLTLRFAQDEDEDVFINSVFTREKYERIIAEGGDPERN